MHLLVLEILQRQILPDDSLLVILPPWTADLTADLRRQFRDSLRVYLFGWNSFLSQRLQISLAAFCQVCFHALINCARAELAVQTQCEYDYDIQQLFQQAEKAVRDSLWPRLLRVIIRHLVAVLGVLTR